MSKHTRIIKPSFGVVASVAAVISIVFGSHPAMALTMGEVFCNVADNLYPFIDVFNWTAYCASAVFIIQGVLHLRGHFEEPRQYPHHKTFALFLAGALLSILPSFAGTIIETIFQYGGSLGDGGGGLGFCVASKGATSTSGTASTPDVMLTNLVKNIQYPLEMLMSVIAITMGIFLVIRGLMKAAKYGNDPKAHSITHILTNIIIGAVLISFGDSVSMVMSSLFGNDGHIMSYNSLSWGLLDGMGDTSGFQIAVRAALTFFQLIGLIAFVRGWHIIRHSIEGVGQATFSQGLTHIIGGVFAINIYQFVQMVDNSLGTKFFS